MSGPFTIAGIFAHDAVAFGTGAEPPFILICYRRGTRILTARGEAPIESLEIGSKVVTMSGALRPIRWIGRRSYSGEVASGNRAVLPILIRAGALSDGVPRRDLWISPQHAMYLDGMLIPASTLVNGVSISQAETVEELSYLHLEFDTHEVIYAEGALSESFVDDENRGGFDNAAEYDALYPDAARVPARFCAPRTDDGEALEVVRKRLAARAASVPPASHGNSHWRGHLDLVRRERIAGWARDEDEPGRPVLLRILDNGVPLAEVLADRLRDDLKAAGIGGGRHAFSLTVPGGLAPDTRHLIEVQRVDDGRVLFGSPYVLEAADNAVAVIRNALPARWRGNLDSVTRQRIEGWAWDEGTPKTPMALVILDNGEVIGRVLANRYREDLESAGMGDGRHGFEVVIPGGLSPFTPHVIQVLGEADGCEMPNSPVVIAPAASFDAALEHAVSDAVIALASQAERDRVLSFLAAQMELLLQQSAEAAAGREARLIHRQFEHRWGKADGLIAAPASVASSRRALVIDDLVPAVDRNAGSIAILSHMRALQSLGYEVSFVASNALSPRLRETAALEAQGIQCCQTPYYASVEEVLRRQKDGFEVIYLHRASNAAKYLMLARQYCQKARILYGVANLHHARLARQAKVEGRPTLLAYSRRMRLAECMAAATADAVITHSPLEKAWLRHAVTGCNARVVPWAIPVRPNVKPWQERHGIAFIADFGHASNMDAARFLTRDIMPRVWKEDPSIECLLVGSRMPESIKRLEIPGIVPMGHVPDLATIYERVRLTAAPLRYGAGVKGMVLHSLASGVPCVMSPIAAEGIALPDVLAASIGADAAQMADRILHLHASEAEAQASAKEGLAFIRAGYTEEAVAEGLKAAIEGRHALGESRREKQGIEPRDFNDRSGGVGLSSEVSERVTDLRRPSARHFAA
jgi:glycosyltransferase involved in cell wall biosynthesis